MGNGQNEARHFSCQLKFFYLLAIVINLPPMNAVHGTEFGHVRLSELKKTRNCIFGMQVLKRFNTKLISTRTKNKNTVNQDPHF